MTLKEISDGEFDPAARALHSDYVDSSKFFGRNGLLRLAMFVNVMTRPEHAQPDLFTLTIPSYQEGYPPVELKSRDGSVARFEPFAVNQEEQWVSVKATIGHVAKVYEGLPNLQVEDEIFTRLNAWFMAHCPEDQHQEFVQRWDSALGDVAEVAADAAARVKRQPA